MKTTPVLFTNYSVPSKPKFDPDTVNQCIRVLEKRFMGDLNREDMEVRRCIEAIRVHFGIDVSAS